MSIVITSINLSLIVYLEKLLQEQCLLSTTLTIVLRADNVTV